MTQRTTWPVLKRYEGEHLNRIAMPLGGIGTGSVSLGGRGDLRDWEVMNRPAKGFTPGPVRAGAPFLALRAQRRGALAVTRLLEGPVPVSEYEGASGARTPNHGFPRLASCRFEAAYPLAQVLFDDPELPLTPCIQAFNPLIPADAEASGLPVAVIRVVLHNRGSKGVSATLCLSCPNFIGFDGREGRANGNRNTFRDEAGIRGLFMDSTGVDAGAPQWGTMAIATTARRGLSHRCAWLQAPWGTSALDFWDDFHGDGRLEDRSSDGEQMPIGSLAVSLSVPARSTKEVTFLIAWHFPNRVTWTPCEESCADNVIGNEYTTRFADAWAAAAETARDLRRLERDTVRFVSAFCDSDLPEVVKEAALFNLSTLRTQTCFRTPDGKLFGWEGYNDGDGCCMGSCTHVWNYEQSVPFLFADLACSMREVEFLHATAADGMMSFRTHLPLSRAQGFGKAAADGQMGCLVKVYREWQLSGDDDWLRLLWPQVRRALEFCWIQGGWDADADGVMEGCQHNTMDVEYFGPNPQMGGWYLAALRAVEEMALHLGENAFADLCRNRFETGSRWLDEKLFNGEYYEHEIRPPRTEADVAPALRLDAGAADVTEPDYQLGSGCLVDQLIGQLMAHVVGLGYLLRRSHVQRTLRSISRHNHRRSLHDHANVMRSYALGDEAALLMASYPKGRPAKPFPYFTEVMTGFEYSAAIGMLYEGQVQRGLGHMADIRARYDGRRRNPFDEAECGHHYARAMIAWAGVLALSGFRFSAVTGRMTFAAGSGRHFWSTGRAWGSCRVHSAATSTRVELVCLGGAVEVRELALAETGVRRLPRLRRLRAGQRLRCTVVHD